jgi:hypothetical protein
MINDWLQIIIMVICLILILISIFWIMPYMYNDCIKVGHTNLYCILHIFK